MDNSLDCDILREEFDIALRDLKRKKIASVDEIQAEFWKKMRD